MTPLLASLLTAQFMRLELARGAAAAALRLAEEHGLKIEDAGNFVREAEYLTLVRVYLFQENPDAALAVLERLQPAAESTGSTGRLIEWLMLRALIYQARREMSSALIVLEQALVLAEPQGYVRTFVDEGERLARLLRQRGMESRSAKINAYVHHLLITLGVNDALPLP